MIRIPDDGILYHGSYTEIKEIDLLKCRKGLDFGTGFYLTSSRKQADSYVSSAIGKAKRNGLVSENYRDSQGRISIFHFRPNPVLFIHYFDEADEEWLHFVACNRNTRLFPELRKKYAGVDIVGGKVADDFTAMILNSYMSGVYGQPGTQQADHTAIELLEPERLRDQFCFRTKEAIASLSFVRSERHGN